MYLKEILCAIFGKGGNVSKKCFKLFFFSVKMAETIKTGMVSHHPTSDVGQVLNRFQFQCFPSSELTPPFKTTICRDRCYDIKNIFDKKWAFLTLNRAKF
jgi:hypothetical protein